MFGLRCNTGLISHAGLYSGKIVHLFRQGPRKRRSFLMGKQDDQDGQLRRADLLQGT